MDITRDIDSLTHFKRNSSEVIEQLKSTGQPMVLTVNGKAEVVVQDAASYQAMLDLLDRAEAIAGIKRGLDSVEKGEGIPAEKAFERLGENTRSRKRHEEIPPHHSAPGTRRSRSCLPVDSPAGAQAAARWFNGFVEALDTLTEFPNRCGLAPENGAVEPEIRQLLYGGRSSVYRAIFAITQREVHVLHIRHTARTTLSSEDLADDI